MFDFSRSQLQFSKNALLNDFRIDGRSPNQKRSIHIKQNILDNLSGSSYVNIDNGKIQLYTGIKLKISKIDNHTKRQNKVLLQLSSMRKLTTQLHNCMIYLQQLLQEHFIDKQKNNFKELVIPNSKQNQIQMHIQVFLLCQPHISMLEGLYYSIKQALLSTSVPKMECFANQVTGAQTIQITGQTTNINLNIQSLCVIGVIQKKFIIDMTPLQFQSVDSAYLVIVKDQKIIGFQSLKGSIKPQEAHKVCKIALNNLK